jgi:MFS transporter, PHS family, inorganic phosphate transporter
MTGKSGGDVDEIRRLEVMRTSDQLTTPKASFKDFFTYYGKWRNFKVLLGAAGSWFVLDVAFYGLGLNSSTVLTAIGYATGANVYETLYNLGAGNAILVCAGAIPGYWCTVALVDTVGRKPIQLMGFSALTILFLVWGFDFFNISANAMFAIYVLAQFFFNFGMSPYPPFYPPKLLLTHLPSGPNATTFIVPGECFPTRYRSTSHGISAASGKLGSIIAQAAIAPLRTRGAAAGATGAAANPWQDNVMKIYAFFMLLGVFLTLLIPETKRITLEQLAAEADDTASGIPAAGHGVVEEGKPEADSNDEKAATA